MILDSRGAPTTEVEVTTADGTFRAACPSGASTGSHEALELRDGDKAFYFGKGVQKALDNIKNVITPAIMGMDVCDQAAMDAKLQELDGTANRTFQKLGANSVLPVSMACCVAAAAHSKLPLYKYIAKISGTSTCKMPVPCFNILNGGKHAGNLLAPQEYMIAPYAAASMCDSIRYGAEVYNELKAILKKKFGLNATTIGDEGGFAPAIEDPEEPLKLIVEAIKAAGLEGKMGICMDVAASEFYCKDQKKYNLTFKTEGKDKFCTGAEMGTMYVDWCKKYPIISIEDPFDENDFESYAGLLAAIKAAGLKTQVVGDDLTVS